MDYQKTGALISSRRSELGLTQKALADQLNVSDRTISKWERGVGFPDVSLLEPLAETLGLSLLELFHGERTVEPELSLEAEASVREAIRTLRPAIKARLRKARVLLILLSVLLAAAAAVLLFLLFDRDHYYVHSIEPVTAAQATERFPDSLITTEDYDLGKLLLADSSIASQFSADSSLQLDDTVTAPYCGLISLGGVPADSFRIDVIFHSIYVDFFVGSSRCILSFKENGTVEKTLCTYDKNGNTDCIVHNTNNTDFTFTYEKRDLFFPSG